jgi:hypothetical protein
MLVNCVGYRKGAKLADIPVEAISRYLHESDCLVWVVLSSGRLALIGA